VEAPLPRNGPAAAPEHVLPDSSRTQATPVPVSRAPSFEAALGWRRHAAEAVRLVAIVVAVFIGLRSVIQTFNVDGPSMNPNLRSGQRVLVNKAVYWHVEGTPFEGLIPAHREGSIEYLFGGPQRGDVVIFRPPGESEFDADLIKRVIGLPGDTVSIQTGTLYVNDVAQTEPYVAFAADYTFPAPGRAVIVPSDSYFVLGDNRPVSADSHLGWFVPVEKLVGQAWLTYWPPDQWGLLARGDIGP
jgi:signal peptidase I